MRLECEMAKRDPRKKPNLRDAQRDSTRVKLVDAAIVVFETHGFRAATIAQIAQLAGANRATFYLHFPNKEAVAMEIGARLAPEIAALFQALDAMESPRLDDVRRWVSKMAAYTKKRRHLLAVATEAHVSDAVLSTQYMVVLGALADGMVRLLGRHAARARSAARTRVMLQMAQMERVFFVTIVRGVKFPQPDLLEALAQGWWNLLRS
jgi:AcrR family transcriptional regulator